VDTDPDTRYLAEQNRVVEQVSADPAELLQEADLIILAAPVHAILALLRKLPAMHPGPAVVIDLGSTKRRVAAVMQALPERFDPLGGHPMCGKEKGSLAQADAQIYRGARFAFTPLERTSLRARAIADELAHAVGACPLWLDADTHDRWTAATSHFPYLLSNALAAATPEEAAPLIGPGFRSTSRLAATPPAMMGDVLMTNRDNVLAALRRFRTSLDALEACLENEDWDGLQACLAQGAACQGQLLSSAEKGS
jgi:prephenate dehydrogenase